VPNVSTFDGIQDLFSLCNLVEMANILHPETYVRGSLCVHKQCEMMEGRALSWEMVAWVLGNYEFDGHLTVEDFY
jgi:hypothetical protein